MVLRSCGRRVAAAVLGSRASYHETQRARELRRQARDYLRGKIDYPWDADPELEAEIKRQAAKDNIRTL